MKKLLLIFGFIFLATTATAEKSADFSCPHSYNEKVSALTRCDDQPYQNLLTELFLAERVNYKTHLKAVKTDTKTNPERLTRDIFSRLKQSKSCYIQICADLLNNCQTQNAAKLREQQRYQRCQNYSNLFFNVQLIETQTTLQSNHQRKERSLFRERFRQLEGKMHQYFAPLYLKLLNRLTDFDGKFTNFTKNPL